jgi:hypothetical protein
MKIPEVFSYANKKFLLKSLILLINHDIIY